MSFRKQQQGASNRLAVPPITVSPSCLQCLSNGTHKVVIAIVRSQGAIVKGELGNTCVGVMFDFRSSISLMIIKENLINYTCDTRYELLTETWNSDRCYYRQSKIRGLQLVHIVNVSESWKQHERLRTLFV